MKRKNKYITAIEGISMQHAAVQELLGAGGLKDYLAGIVPEQRNKTVAMMLAFKSQKEVVALTGLTLRMVRRAATLHQDIIHAAAAGRNATIAALAERKAIDTLEGLDPSQIPHEKKPQAIKYLVDAADIANQHNVVKGEKQEEDTMELVFKIRRRMRPERNADSEGDAVDAEFSEEKDKQIPEKAP